LISDYYYRTIDVRGSQVTIKGYQFVDVSFGADLYTEIGSTSRKSSQSCTGNHHAINGKLTPPTSSRSGAQFKIYYHNILYTTACVGVDTEQSLLIVRWEISSIDFLKAASKNSSCNDKIMEAFRNITLSNLIKL
jgi:hypothetical protein